MKNYVCAVMGKLCGWYQLPNGTHQNGKTTQIVYEHNNLVEEALTKKRQLPAIVRAILYASKKNEKHENIITRH